MTFSWQQTRGLVSILVLLDLSAAFDTIDHNILLERLQHEIKMTGTALDWFKSYLSDRFPFVNVNDAYCERPKGSSWSSTGFGAWASPVYSLL